jgi:hypothetical protein
MFSFPQVVPTPLSYASYVFVKEVGNGTLLVVSESSPDKVTLKPHQSSIEVLNSSSLVAMSAQVFQESRAELCDMSLSFDNLILAHTTRSQPQCVGRVEAITFSTLSGTNTLVELPELISDYGYYVPVGWIMNP